MLLAKDVGEVLPACPIVLGAAILDGGDRKTVAKLGEVVDHAGGVELLALALEVVDATLEELGAGAIQRKHDVVAGPVTGRLRRLC